jgi:hypothetical protein
MFSVHTAQKDGLDLTLKKQGTPHLHATRTGKVFVGVQALRSQRFLTAGRNADGDAKVQRATTKGCIAQLYMVPSTLRFGLVNASSFGIRINAASPQKFSVQCASAVGRFH